MDQRKMKLIKLNTTQRIGCGLFALFAYAAAVLVWEMEIKRGLGLNNQGKEIAITMLGLGTVAAIIATVGKSPFK